MTNQANTVCILKILTEYSDAGHILRMQDLIGKMKGLYGLDVDRRTVYSAIDLLKRLGYDISDYSENGEGYFLREREFETAEVHLLMDAVYSHQAISQAQTRKLIGKLQGLLSVHDRQLYRNLTVVKVGRKTENQEVFLSVELLDEAIQQRHQVQFTYLAFGMDKKLHPCREEPYTVSPYQLIFTHEHYYLLCCMAGKKRLSLYRVDLMRAVAPTDAAVEGELTEKELLAAENSTFYAWYGAVETVELRCKKHCLGDVIDKFGPSVRLVPETAETFLSYVSAVPAGVKFWALQYLPHVEVLCPDWLRQAVIAAIRKNPYEYAL